jgi:hypothetical protein
MINIKIDSIPPRVERAVGKRCQKAVRELLGVSLLKTHVRYVTHSFSVRTTIDDAKVGGHWVNRNTGDPFFVFFYCTM